MLIDAVGLAGNLLLSCCAIPQAVGAFRGTTRTAGGFLAAWGAGEVLAAWYGAVTGVGWIILGNYGVSMIIIGAICWAQYFRRAETG